ncbi:Dynamin ARC5 [Chlorella sorokiniana]|uniref:Dynamin ARC5 n=1 Tax=Chlorella sorokiniana TaxID=3076 RepID=A0A2P6TFT0_CHLSO|nr:Dynamin ARC5 [Chlorella sorokiniana]|eukprot:PRW32964.1 Dynamin ARC5 [Chlorella sorokiniana]
MSQWLQGQAAASGGRYAMRASQDLPLEAEEPSRTPPSVRRSSAALRASVLELPSDGSPGRSERAFRTGNERLYEAYNDLHALAQDFEKPFDAPAILVVGHQTDGKSALVEALMGFQFNHVGGGTKTRRPITLHMKYNSACIQPHCFLITDEFGEQEASLEELQDYIENENARLDREAQFWSKEIVVRIEYKFCPNLTIIDTPGLISAAPGKRNSSLQNSAKQVEAMVRMKMEQKEYIILCLEDSNDWSNATTRRLVMQVDPALSRTVVVSTKLDTRIPQFARPHDVEMYLRPPSRLLEPTMLGGSPFFTSVPSGRVGNSKDAIFRSNEHFRGAVAEREAADVAELESRLGRKLEKAERARIGVGQLRRFLEHLLQRRYLENVPTIVPVLEKEYRNASRRLEETQVELHDLHPEKLKEKGRVFRESFLSKLQLLLRGTVAAPPERFGETLADEHIRGGAFVGPDNKPVIVSEHLPNAHMRLFGGAQYHRAMAEFRAGIGTISCPDISREEIVNACGIDDFHDGVNYTRTACVIAVSKARDLFEPFLHQLGYRLAHVQRRMLPIAMHLLQKDGQFLNGHDLFLKRVGAAYHAFIDEFEKACRNKCMEDLQSTTRYVTWSLHTKSRSSLKAMLSKVTAPGSNQHGSGGGGGGSKTQTNAVGESSGATADFLENTLWNRTLGTMSEEIVAALVCQIFEGIRDHFVQSVELKFNCFFLMPIIDTFPTRLREELESAYEEDLDEVFDVAAVRAALEQRLKSLELELHQVERLQRKFAMIHSTLAQQQSNHKGDGVDTPKLRHSEENPLNGLSRSGALPPGMVAAAKASQDLSKAGAKLASLDLGKARQPLASMR